jgi:hypothetical protein
MQHNDTDSACALPSFTGMDMADLRIASEQNISGYGLPGQRILTGYRVTAERLRVHRILANSIRARFSTGVSVSASFQRVRND